MTLPRVTENLQLDSEGLIAFGGPVQLHSIVDGKPLEASSTLEIPHPLSDTVASRMPTSLKDTLAAIDYARRFPLGCEELWNVEARGETFLRAANLVKERWPLLRAGIRAGFPKSAAEADGEIHFVHRFLQMLTPEFIRRLHSPSFGGPGFGYCTESETRFTPWGKSAVIAPFNYPIEIPGLQLAAGLACGNHVIFKPHEYVGLAGQLLYELLIDAGVPPQALTILHGMGVDCPSLATDESIDFVLFTGSSTVANQLASTRMKSEQSGINWVWALPKWEGASEEKLAASIAKAAFGLGGQRCSSARIAVLHKSWQNVGYHMMMWAERHLNFEDGSLPVVMSWGSDKVESTIQEMIDEGFALNSRGDQKSPFTWTCPYSAPEGRFDYSFVAPVIFSVGPEQLSDRAVRARLQQERFWPNLIVINYETDDEAQAIAAFLNSLPERLTCAIACDNKRDAQDLLRMVRPNGVVNWGNYPGTTGAEWYKPFGPVLPNGAFIGGSMEQIRQVWMGQYGMHCWGI